LPDNGPVLAFAEDHVDPDLLFAGTEFGLFFTSDGGKKWTRLKGGLPTIAVRDLAIQKRMNDLVVGTFGRGIYVLDDYTPLRGLKPETLDKEAHLFPVRSAPLYIPTRQYGLRGKSFQGASFYTAENPPFGATFTYHLKEGFKTRKEQRQEAEKKTGGKGIPYPTKDQLRAEEEEEAPAVLLTIADSTGHVLRTLTGPVSKGFHRVSWDLREPSASLPRPRPPAGEDVFRAQQTGPLVMPGTYKVTLSARVDGATRPLAGPEEFTVSVNGASAGAADRKALFAFQRKVTRLQRAVAGTLEVVGELERRIGQIKKALDHTPEVEAKWQGVARSVEKRNREVLRQLRGDLPLRKRNENTPESIAERVERIVENQRFALAKPTRTDEEQYALAGQDLARELGKLRALIQGDLKALEKALDRHLAPWTPGRLPEWEEKGGSPKR
jgi:hypothetical protein